jgi:hypothetical protein
MNDDKTKCRDISRIKRLKVPEEREESQQEHSQNVPPSTERHANTSHQELSNTGTTQPQENAEEKQQEPQFSCSSRSNIKKFHPFESQFLPFCFWELHVVQA